MEQLIVLSARIATTSSRLRRCATTACRGVRTNRGRREGLMTGRTWARSPASPSAVGVPQRAIRRDPVADALLELLELGKPALGGTRPDGLAIQRDLEDSFVAGPQGDFRELTLERREQLLRHPLRAEKPAPAGAVRDLDARHAGARQRATA